MRRSCPAKASQGGVKKCFLFPKLIKSTTLGGGAALPLFLLGMT